MAILAVRLERSLHQQLGQARGIQVAMCLNTYVRRECSLILVNISIAAPGARLGGPSGGSSSGPKYIRASEVQFDSR